MGAAAVSPPWCDDPIGSANMRAWYEEHRSTHGLPPLPFDGRIGPGIPTGMTDTNPDTGQTHAEQNTDTKPPGQPDSPDFPPTGQKPNAPQGEQIETGHQPRVEQPDESSEIEQPDQ